MAFLGGVLGVLTSGLLEYDTLRRLDVAPMLAVAVIEEAAKLLGPALALCLTRKRHPATGLILGVASGAGFAVLETLGYSAVALVHSHENLATVDGLLFQCGLFSPATHMAWTGLTAVALWSAARRRWYAPAIAAAAGAFAIAAALHTAWDCADTAGYVVLSAASLSILGASAHAILRLPTSSIVALSSAARRRQPNAMPSSRRR